MRRVLELLPSSMRSVGQEGPKQLAKAASAPDARDRQHPSRDPRAPGHHGWIAKHAHDAAQAASDTLHEASERMHLHDTLGRPLFGPNRHKSARSHHERPHGQSSFSYLEMHLPENERQEALEACKLARLELLRFVAAAPPPQSLRSCVTLLFVVLLRPFIAPFVGGCMEGWLPIPEFMQALLALGGIERASVMLAICRFDADQNGNLTDHEYRVFQDGGKELLRNTVSRGRRPACYEWAPAHPVQPPCTAMPTPRPSAHR